MARQTKKFGKKVYKIYASFKTKAKAYDQAKALRRMGFSARVSPAPSSWPYKYILWIRGKKK